MGYKHTERPEYGRGKDKFHPEGSAARALQLLQAFCEDAGIDNPIGWAEDWKGKGDAFSHADCEDDNLATFYLHPEEGNAVVRVEIDTDTDHDGERYVDRSKVIRFTVEVRDA